MIYTTGTVAISGNTLTGTGTNFTAAGSLIRVGCTVIAMSNPVQVFQITAVGSATSLSVTPAASPALAAGTKFAILLSDSLSVDGLAQDIVETFTLYQKNISGFADVMNGSTDVTITINGVAVTVPGQKSLAKKGANSDITSLSALTIALSVAQGGTGAKNASDARANLGLKGAATFEVDTSLLPPGQVTQPLLISAVRDYRSITSYDLPGAYPLGISGGMTSGAAVPGMGQADTTFVGMINLRGWSDSSGHSTCFQIAGNANKFGYRPTSWNSTYSAYYYSSFREIYHTANTTKASDGTLKAASPIVQIFYDGRCQLNEESEGCTVTRLAIGEYLIEGCMGLNADAAWGGIDGGFDIPKDRNRQALVWLDYEVNADGSVLLKTYHRTYPDAPEFARNLIGVKDEAGGFTETIKNGNPIDIPVDQYVSVRVEMPSDSMWNQRQEELRMAMEQAEREREQTQQDTPS